MPSRDGKGLLWFCAFSGFPLFWDSQNGIHILAHIEGCRPPHVGTCPTAGLRSLLCLRALPHVFCCWLFCFVFPARTSGFRHFGLGAKPFRLRDFDLRLKVLAIEIDMPGLG